MQKIEYRGKIHIRRYLCLDCKIMVVICEFEGCDKGATYGTKENKFMRCKKHKIAGMKWCAKQACNYVGCIKQALFGIDKIITCGDHKLPDYKNLRQKICSICSKTAKYKGNENTWYCKVHSIDRNVEDKALRKKCSTEGCNTTASFNFIGSKPIKCSEHKEDRMINISKCCNYEGCNKSAGYKGVNTKKYCAEHKTDQMKDISSKYCTHNGCSNKARYARNGTKTKIYCIIHKELYDDLYLVRSACDECLKPNAWGIVGGKPTKCKKHKLAGMVKLKYAKCDHDGCLTTGRYVSDKGKFCAKHKIGNAKIQCAKCELCDDPASRGPIFGKFIRCDKHAEKNHVSKHFIRPKCKGGNCKSKPLYGLAGSTLPEYCEDHKLGGMVNIIERSCNMCKLNYLIPEGIDLCIYCNDAVVLARRKEGKIKELFDAKGIKYDSNNKVIDSNCANRRPDFVIDYNTFFVVVEVDEYQHKSYRRDCELIRMQQIHQSLGMDTLFIRFNPDSYVDKDGKKIDSYARRENILLKLLKSIGNMDKLNHYLSVIYLFYDGFEGKPIMQKIEY